MSLAFEHLSTAIQLVNPRLSSKNAVSDINIAVVCVLAQFERSRNRFEDGLVHMDGLEKMIRLRGGICALMREKGPMAQKLIRLDLEYALNLGTRPRFTLEEITSDQEAASWLHRQLKDNSGIPTCPLAMLPGLDEQLLHVAADMTGFAWLIHGAKTGKRRVPFYTAHNALLILQYRLLELAPLSASRMMMGRTEHAVHIGLAAFVMPFMHGLSGLLQDSSLIGALLTDTIQANESVTDEAGQHALGKEFLLWLSFVLWAAMPDRAPYAWLASTVSKLMHDQNLSTWEDVTEILRKYPWIPALHGKVGRTLFDMARRTDSKCILLGMLD